MDCSTTVPCSSMKPFGIFLSTDVTRAFLWFLNLHEMEKYCKCLMGSHEVTCKAQRQAPPLLCRRLNERLPDLTELFLRTALLDLQLFTHKPVISVCFFCYSHPDALT